jgi:homoserine dehydrogenase
VNFKEVYVEGISAIAPMDIEYATEFGYTIKLLAIAKVQGEGESEEIEARVHPTMIANNSPLARVGGIYNAIQVTGDAVGEIMLYGRGAGSMPTASAVVSDLIDIARNIRYGGVGRVPPTGFLADQRRPLRIRPIENVTGLYYLRFMVLDRPGVLSQLSGALGKHDISISSVLQRGRQEGQTVPVVMTTHIAMERNLRAALREIDALPSVSSPTTVIRIEGEDR